MTYARTLSMLAALAALTAGCGDAVTERVAEEAAEQAAGGDVDIDSDDGSISIESSEGSMQMGAGGSVPESFPDDMPLPETDFEVANTFEQSGDDGLELQMALQTEATVDELRAYFAEELPANGWEILDERTQSMNGLSSVTFSLEHEDGERGGIVTVTQADDDPTLVNYGLGTTS